MDTHAARRARRKAIKADLLEAFTDEEATPPEWADLLSEVRESSAELRSSVVQETRRFIDEPDIKRALERRAQISEDLRSRVSEINGKIKRLNMLAPQARFTRSPLDPDDLLRPLYRSSRATRPAD
jgi:hypothetical protein